MAGKRYETLYLKSIPYGSLKPRRQIPSQGLPRFQKSRPTTSPTYLYLRLYRQAQGRNDQPPQCFEQSVYDLLGLLVAGGTIVFPEPSRSKDPASWVSLIQQHQITLWNSVPQLAALLIDAVTQSPLSQKEAIALASLRL